MTTLLLKRIPPPILLGGGLHFQTARTSGLAIRSNLHNLSCLGKFRGSGTVVSDASLAERGPNMRASNEHRLTTRRVLGPGVWSADVEK